MLLVGVTVVLYSVRRDTGGTGEQDWRYTEILDAGGTVWTLGVGLYQ